MPEKSHLMYVAKNTDNLSNNHKARKYIHMSSSKHCHRVHVIIHLDYYYYLFIYLYSQQTKKLNLHKGLSEAQQ